MLLDEHYKAVELFAENLFWGNISIDSQEIKKNEKPMIDFAEDLDKWFKLRETDKESKQFNDLTEDLYHFIFIVRFTGLATGEMRDRIDENEVKELREKNRIAGQNIKELTGKIIKLENGNHKLHEENILLSNELEDQKNIINSYENSSIRKG